MRRAFLLLTAALLPVSRVSAANSNWDNFVPAGWVLESAQEGDLNGDGEPESALVLLQDDPAFRVSNEGLGAEILDTNPRRLLLLSSSGGALHEVQAIDGFLPPPGDTENTCLADPLAEGGVTVRNGKLFVAMQDWLSCGSYGVTNRTYTFRLESGQLRLIGYDRTDFSRASGEGAELSANYLNGRMKLTEGVQIIGDQETRAKERWMQFPAAPVHAQDITPWECLASERAAGWC